jgi:hypothetical protein
MKKTDVEDITSLIRQRAGLPKLAPAKERQPIGGKSGVSTIKEITPAGSGGMASPLTETARTVTAHNDGTHNYYVAVESTVEDANGDSHTINWLDPASPNITII